MPSHAAMTDKLLTLSPDDSVETALETMKKAKTEFAPVIDESGAAVGVFSIRALLENLLPVSVAVQGGIQLDIHVGAAPGIAKRLKKNLYYKVGDLMERKFAAVYPETPLWEGVNALVLTGTPVLVVEPKSGKVLGMITGQSAIDELNRMKDSET